MKKKEAQQGATPLRIAKLLMLLLIPFLGILYFSSPQNAYDISEKVKPFQSFKAQDCALKNSLGETKSLSFHAPLTVLNFWATDCPPCIREFPEMIELKRAYDPSVLKFIFVSVDQDKKSLNKFFKENLIDLDESEVLFDESMDCAKKWGSEKFPETYIVRSDEWVVEKVIGEQKWNRSVVHEYFKKLLEKTKQLKSKFRIQRNEEYKTV